MDKYNDIINLEYFKSNTRKQMNIKNRTNQFAPFSALSGYAEAINETKRLTECEIKIEDDLKEIINEKLNKINKQIKHKPFVIITYFKKDEQKKGGKYITISKNVKKILLHENKLIFSNNTIINFKAIISIEGEIFK